MHQLKREMERKINKLLHGFETRTGIRIERVDYSGAELVSDDEFCVLTSPKCNVKCAF